jgi:hypothetical protein
MSSDSPPGHAAIVGAELTGPAKTATAGATATATANPLARISRRAGSIMVAIVTLSVVVDRSRDSHCRARQVICWRRHYADYQENAASSSIKMVRVSHFWKVAVRWLWHPVNDGCCGTVMCSQSLVFQANEVVRCG